MNRDVLAMIQDIRRAIEDGNMSLNEWETDFVRNMSVLGRAGQKLSDKQDEILERMLRPTAAIYRMLSTARAHGRLLNMCSLDMDDPFLKPLKERFELELRRAYEKGRKDMARAEGH